MRYIKYFESKGGFRKSAPFSRRFKDKSIDSILNDLLNIDNYTINDDGTVDVNGDVDIRSSELYSIPVRFRNVDGNFICCNNKLVSLYGCPKSIGGDFDCSRNDLKSLEGGPERVGGDFNCSINILTSLNGCPISVGRYFDCSRNNLTSLEGCSNSIGGDFDCDDNPVYKLWELFEDKSKIELFNDYDIVRGDTVILDRLNDFLRTIYKDITSVEGYKTK